MTSAEDPPSPAVMAGEPLAPPATRTLRPLIVGLGTAGRDLHLACLVQLRDVLRRARLTGDEIPWAVDPLVGQESVLPGTAVVVRRLDEVDSLDPDSTVVHLCTPPANRVANLYEIAEAGYRRIICEKPLAEDLDDARAIAEIAREASLDVVVTGVWLTSELTGRLKYVLDGAGLGALRRVSIDQDKPRFARTLARPSHRSAFDVELPHSIGVALFLAGRDATVESAECTDMVLEGKLVPDMGGAAVTLRHSSGVVTTISSDLTAPVRRRRIELDLEGGTIVGHYPISRDDGHAQLVVHRDGAEPQHSVFVDEPLTRFVFAAYRWFAGVGERLYSDVELNVAIVAALTRAKEVAGLVSDAMPSSADRSDGASGP